MYPITFTAARNTSMRVYLVANSSAAANQSQDPLGGHTVWQVTLIVLFTGALSLITIIGNLLVMVAFKVNSHLKTVNNYFLLSLACADLILGAISMNLYTTYIIMGRWALGTFSCDIWLAIDYVASNASVMNLLIISFDRFFSVTRPLTYRAKRTPKRAAIMITMAWAISFVLWAPAILFWQYFVGERTVPSEQCFIQFLSQPIITFGTAIAAFYLPVTIMIILYWRIYRETENRAKELAGLMGSESREASSQTQQASGNSTKSDSSCGPTNVSQIPSSGSKSLCCLYPKRHSSRKAYLEPSSDGSWVNIDEEGSPGNSTSEEDETPLEMKTHCSVVICLPQIRAGRAREGEELPRPRKEVPGCLENRSLSRVMSKARNAPQESKRSSRLTMGSLSSLATRDSLLKMQPKAKKRKRLSLIKEKKAAKTLSAILLAFIITWTPYNIMVLVSTFCTDCIPETLWQLGYWLCYVNSTVNPVCYALCNKSFRVTFMMLLQCRWDKRKWGRPHRHVPKSFHQNKFSSAV
ncbi:muscarinic acetylcholine receptor M1-like [Acipenser oxyrinchus oxyrinchus]|uniref:Muscarinic acetylcholine receptor n=1 Tax=Acipenser oxyrinchus oxyrinchus TaxID=40147 RepID=A0AAD8CGG9_ACIOX|nr:muscarinic acetylcholine receptor M1-like [Acipenser oxyrinchus oxyrinchus]KAK1154870.1 muscarinic acetylcholine receptor M1-like [Acipenser oxyrinchus oxyrinchus]